MSEPSDPSNRHLIMMTIDHQRIDAIVLGPEAKTKHLFNSKVQNWDGDHDAMIGDTFATIREAFDTENCGKCLVCKPKPPTAASATLSP